MSATCCPLVCSSDTPHPSLPVTILKLSSQILPASSPKASCHLQSSASLLVFPLHIIPFHFLNSTITSESLSSLCWFAYSLFSITLQIRMAHCWGQSLIFFTSKTMSDHQWQAPPCWTKWKNEKCSTSFTILFWQPRWALVCFQWESVVPSFLPGGHHFSLCPEYIFLLQDPMRS